MYYTLADQWSEPDQGRFSSAFLLPKNVLDDWGVHLVRFLS